MNKKKSLLALAMIIALTATMLLVAGAMATGAVNVSTTLDTITKTNTEFIQMATGPPLMVDLMEIASGTATLAVNGIITIVEYVQMPTGPPIIALGFVVLIGSACFVFVAYTANMTVLGLTTRSRNLIKSLAHKVHIRDFSGITDVIHKAGGAVHSLTTKNLHLAQYTSVR